MAIDIILLAVMVVGVAIKWTTTVSIRDRHAKLADANENVDPEFWLSLSAQHSILAQLKA